MRSSHSIAVWLLERLGLDVALTGDLLEERARGRSVIWYWRQVLIAIWTGTWGAVLDHKVLALRAVATGCATNYFLWFLYLRFLQPLMPLGPTSSARSWITNLSFILLTQSVTGWVVARTHRAHPIPMVSVFAIWLVLWSLVSGIDLSYVRMLLVDSFDQPRFRPYLARYLTGVFVPILAVVTGLLLGGIVGARPKRQPSAPALT
jgi:hypothetical protein